MPVVLLDIAPHAAWTPWFAAASFVVGLSIAGFLLALPGRAFGVPRWQRASRLGLLLALAAGFAAPPCLLAALARPDRVGLLFSRGESGAWMATGATLMPWYLLALAVFAWTTMRRDLAAAEGRGVSRLHRIAALGGGGAPRLRMLAMIATALLGFGVFLATGAALRPAWNGELLLWHLAATALAGALGGVLVLDHLLDGAQDAATRALLARITAGVLVLGLALGRESWHAPVMFGTVAAVLLALPARTAWITGLLAMLAGFVVRWDLLAPFDNGTVLAPLGVTGLLVMLLALVAGLAPVLGPRRQRSPA